MIIGVCKINLRMPAVSSLKEKRQVVKKVLERTRNRFNVSAAEVDYNDVKQRAVLGFVVAGNDSSFVNSVIDKIISFIDEMYLAEIINSEIEIIGL